MRLKLALIATMAVAPMAAAAKGHGHYCPHGYYAAYYGHKKVCVLKHYPAKKHVHVKKYHYGHHKPHHGYSYGYKKKW